MAKKTPSLPPLPEPMLEHVPALVEHLDALARSGYYRGKSMPTALGMVAAEIRRSAARARAALFTPTPELLDALRVLEHLDRATLPDGPPLTTWPELVSANDAMAVSTVLDTRVVPVLTDDMQAQIVPVLEDADPSDLAAMVIDLHETSARLRQADGDNERNELATLVGRIVSDLFDHLRPIAEQAQR